MESTPFFLIQMTGRTVIRTQRFTAVDILRREPTTTQDFRQQGEIVLVSSYAIHLCQTNGFAIGRRRERQ
jgi:hypothetical protein